MNVRRTLATLTATAALCICGAVSAVPAQAQVTSASGASAHTTLVCMFGGFSVYPDTYGFQWVRVFNTQTQAWTDWYTPTDLRVHGFAKRQYPATVSIYAEYAYWNGVAWEYAGEWAQVNNARGEYAGLSC